MGPIMPAGLLGSEYCSGCRQINPTSSRFCDRCGLPVRAISCRGCGRPIELYSRFCDGCGFRVPSSEIKARVFDWRILLFGAFLIPAVFFALWLGLQYLRSTISPPDFPWILAVQAIAILAFFNWACHSTFGILGFAASKYDTDYSPKRADNIEMVIVSVASMKVANSLFECIEENSRALPDIPLSLLVDAGSELLPKIRKNYPHLKLIIVPAAFRPDLVGKGRAMAYFIKWKVDEDRWYTFVDDDNLILDDRFLYELPVYEAGGFVAANMMVYPRPGRSLLCSIMDATRDVDDKTYYRAIALTHTGMAGMHGEFLTAKGSALLETQAYSKRSITEDYRLGMEVTRRGLKVYQSKTGVSIRSPNSLRDLFRQRGRWFRGIASDLPDAPPAMLLLTLLREASWITAIVGSWLLVPLWIWWPGLWPFYFGGAYYWLTYAYGAAKAGKPWLALGAPVYGVLESLSLWTGLKMRKFVVIDKN